MASVELITFCLSELAASGSDGVEVPSGDVSVFKSPPLEPPEFPSVMGGGSFESELLFEGTVDIAVITSKSCCKWPDMRSSSQSFAQFTFRIWKRKFLV